MDVMGLLGAVSQFPFQGRMSTWKHVQIGVDIPATGIRVRVAVTDVPVCFPYPHLLPQMTCLFELHLGLKDLEKNI